MIRLNRSIPRILGITIVYLLLTGGAASAQYKFVDRTAESGIFQQCMSVADIGSGVVAFDVNNDSWEDFYLTGGIDSDRVFINMKNGTFAELQDIKFRMHNNFNSYPHGGVALDFNNDGHTDLFEICRRKDLLWRNNGDGTFTNYSQQANIEAPLNENVSNGASYGDFNGDGYNDIYVGRWVTGELRIEVGEGGELIYRYIGFPNHLYVNNGDGTFTESGMKYHVADTGSTNIAHFFDYDNDGDLDILVGNDFGMFILPNHVYKNLLAETGVAQFVEVAKEIGLDQKIYCMTFTASDFNNDGNFDFSLTNIGPMAYMKNDGGIFHNIANEIGFPSGYVEWDNNIAHTTWTTIHEDFDNDGREDAFVVHGFINALIEDIKKSKEFDTSLFYYNDGSKLVDVTETMGVSVDARGRGAVAVDYDHDGKLDIIYGSVNRSAGIRTRDYRVFHNETPDIPGETRNWIQIQCHAVNTAKEAIGTRIEVWTNGIRQTKQVSTGGGMHSCAPLVKHFGLGGAAVIDSIIIYWPMTKNRYRHVDRYYNVSVNQRITFLENNGVPVTSNVVNVGEKNMHLVLFPAVSSADVSISGAPANAVTRYEIVNLLGASLAEYVGQSETVTLPVSSLNAGQYFIRVTTSDGTKLLRFIKQ